MSESALTGVKVVEFAHVIAGPLAGTLLADFGADVIHVEPPGSGDAARLMGPAKHGVHLWWKVAGRNKRSITLDLRRSEGRSVARRLAAWADVVITNLRPDTLDKWGLSWESLNVINKRLIMLQISGFGATGSMRAAPGFGKVGEARSGVVYITGFPNSPPVHTGFSHGDTVTALMGAFGVLAALHRKTTDPDFAGEWIDLALYESLFRLIEWQVTVFDQLGMIPERLGNRLAVAPAAVINSYQTRDDDWITVTSATPKSVVNVVKLLGLDVDKYRTLEAQLADSDLIDSKLRDWIGMRATDECLQTLARADVIASRIFNVRDIVEDATYAEREDIVTVDDKELGPVKMPAAIPKLLRHSGRVWRAGPAVGEDNEVVYKTWLGIDEREFESLRTLGII